MRCCRKVKNQLPILINKNKKMDLIQEAKKRGYRKGLAIRYCNHIIDYVEGNYFELKDGNVVAFAKPERERKGFEDFTHDTLYDSVSKEWVEIVK